MDTLNNMENQTTHKTVTDSHESESSHLNDQILQMVEREQHLQRYLNGYNTSNDSMTQRATDSTNEFEQSVNLATEYCQKYPELVPFQEAIINEAMLALIESHVGTDEQIDDRKALEIGVQRFQEKLAKFTQKQQTQTSQQQYKNRLLKLDTGFSAPQHQLTSVTQTLKQIGDSDTAFAAFRQYFLQSKGI